MNSRANNFYTIGDITISPNVVLAPMEGVTDLSFRRTVRRLGGVGLTCTEFIPASSLHKGRGRPWETLQFDPDESPVSVQIYGKSPKEMAEGAKVVESSGADICDINMGCPSKRVCSRSGGSALMREPELAVEIVAAVKAAVSIPVTVKMRSGFDSTNRNAVELAYMCQEEGASAITIHWRTREDRYGGVRDVTQIAAAVKKLSVPVIGNGDIVDIESAKAMLEDTGCAGVMVGRGAIADPWLPARISRWQRGLDPLVVSANERKEAMFFYFDQITDAMHSDKGVLGRMKMLSQRFSRALHNGEQLRSKLLRSQSTTELREIASEYFSMLEQLESGNIYAFANSAYDNSTTANLEAGP